ncbi:MAG: hypothetical protein ACI81P_000755 [Neolewinella sp.]|jgi:hypothetical protein
MAPPPHTNIKTLAANLLANAANPAEAERIINEIHTHFKEITEITGYDQKLEHLAAVPAAKGKALGLNHAAQCLLDYKRTTKFLRGVIAAIREKQAAHPGDTIRVFYAGCGPYAPFVTLVAPFFTPEEVQFSLLEINEHSFESAIKLIDDLDYADYVAEGYLADAVTFEVPDAAGYHLLISETLDVLLYRECYVPILMNLLPQFNRELTLIPQNVQITAKLQAPTGSELPEEALGAVLDVRKSVAARNGDQSIPTKLPEVKVDFSALTMTDYHSMLLETRVHVYQDIWLETNESSLTLSQQLILEQPFNYQAMVFTYLLEPGVELTFRLE